ncbi:regulatory protein RecX [Klebsiella pneumoniae]|uniref:Regulatory protein RecX n=1 Tax=Klebsiella pneumoniae TaxID=573 RepID=A0A919I1S7_KLEPN|nr:regulatory protein RecX [Klebsiella pneumoniae]
MLCEIIEVPVTEPSSRRSGYARLLDRAIRILAMRDHSEQELRRKLVAPVMSKNGPEALDVTPTSWSRLSPGVSKTATSTTTASSASSSPAGAAKAMVRRAFAELSQKGIARQVVDQAMRKCDIDWVSLAREQAQRKYGEPLPSAFTEKVKVQRFLLYRGYLMEDIQEIWRNFAD